MYESHFGFSSPPFQLIPDPSFYFSSRGHSNALAFLKFGAHQGEGFIVVTGEIGAGKTTLVRTLLEGLDPTKVVAAPIVSSQLQTGDLPLAILMAFGVPVANQNSSQLLPELAAFLTDLSTNGRRALLIIDEAQNLSTEVIEELRVLTNFQLGKNAMLQVFLVGQPELRTMLQSKSMDQLRQRVTASCHLGPLDAAETRAYVQHRLQRVGWNDRPHFELDAMQQLHRWTGGIPRKINRLCNRLLLAAFLESRDTITPEGVEQIAQDLRAEIGETDEISPVGPSTVPAFQTSTIGPASDEEEEPSSMPEAPPTPEAEPMHIELRSSDRIDLDEAQVHVRQPLPESPAPGVVASHESTLPDIVLREDALLIDSLPEATPPDIAGRREPTFDEASSTATAPSVAAAANPSAAPVVNAPMATEVRAPLAKVAGPAVPARSISVPVPPVAVQVPTPPRFSGPLICLVDSAADYVKARALARVFAANPKLPSIMTVHTGSADALDVGDGMDGVMPGSSRDVNLDIDDRSGAAGAASALFRFDAVLKEHAPAAVMSMGTNNMVLTCSLLAHKCHVPVLRNDAGRRKAWALPGDEMNAVLLERFADISYINDLATYYTLYRVGIPTDRVLCVGDVADNVVHFAAEHTVPPDEVLRRANLATAVLKHPRGYALVTAQLQPHELPNQDALELVSRLSLVGKELPVIWPANPYTVQELRESGQASRLEAARIVLVPALGYLDRIDLLRRARFLIAGATGDLLDEAGALGLQCMVLGDEVVVPMKVNEHTPMNVAQGVDKLQKLVADILAVPSSRRPEPERWDGGPAAKIAVHLENWLHKQGRGKAGNKAARAALASSATV